MREAIDQQQQQDNKKEITVKTSRGEEFKFGGISEKFTKKLYEWEEQKGIAPESSTIALLNNSPRYNNNNSSNSNINNNNSSSNNTEGDLQRGQRKQHQREEKKGGDVAKGRYSTRKPGHSQGLRLPQTYARRV